MRIMVLGPGPAEPTGYGVQQAHLLHILRSLGHDAAAAASASVHGAPILWDGFPVYPKLFADMGQDLACHARHFGADLVIPIMDAWVIEPRAWAGLKLAPFFPVDHAPLSPALRAVLPHFHAAAVYSQWGQRVCQEAGFTVSYIPCSVDTSIYQPTDRPHARDILGWPQDRHIVGMVAANVGVPSRKAFEQQLRAFKYFQDEHLNALLYLHTFANTGNEMKAENLLRMLDTVGLVVDQDVFFVDQYAYLMSVPPATMALAYSAMDVLLSVTTKEGFCLPLVEAQACGTPVITGDWTANAELCFAGWKVPRLEATVYGRTIYDDPLYGHLGGYGVQPRASAIVEMLERAYQMRDCAETRAIARRGALPFDVQAVAERYWRPFLEGL